MLNKENCPYIDQKCNTHAQCVKCEKGKRNMKKYTAYVQLETLFSRKGWQHASRKQTDDYKRFANDCENENLKYPKWRVIYKIIDNKTKRIVITNSLDR